MFNQEEWKDFLTLIEIGLTEDLNGLGDVTSNAIFQGEVSKCKLISKGKGILAGVAGFLKVFQHLDCNIVGEAAVSDGSELKEGDLVAWVEGATKSILTAERTALNLISYLSGISTITEKVVRAARETGNAIILDTRKTLPGYRRLAKYAVRVGGGMNHRFGLYDMILIKDNHIDAIGSITEAVNMVREKWGREFLVEVECRTLQEVEEALQTGVDRILLDNMDAGMTREAVRLVQGRIPLESSGDMTAERVKIYSSLGVEYISVGKLTHSVASFNFSLEVEKK